MRDMVPNPGVSSELLAVLRGPDPSTSVEVIDTGAMSIVTIWMSNSSQYATSSKCRSLWYVTHLTVT